LTGAISTSGGDALATLQELSALLRPLERAAVEPIFRVEEARVDTQRLLPLLGADGIGWTLVSRTGAHCPLVCSISRTATLSTFYSAVGDPIAEFHDEEMLGSEEDALRVAQEIEEFLRSSIERLELWSRGRLLKVSYHPDRLRINGEPWRLGAGVGFGLPFAKKITARTVYAPWLQQAGQS
jgi:hypothetical protein